MRIFSIHKSKSKKQISEKTPKLAAQKFLEKRKVGTVIYLHEHPSGKIHGPYRREYDKNIMKGGLDVFDYRVDRPQNSRTLYPPVLAGTNQLIIKQTRVGFLSNEPRIFFGDNRKTDTADNHYYTYVCKNKDSDINNLISFRKLEDSVNGAPPQIRELSLEEVKKIEPQILLGFYTQYIDRCKEGFSRGRPIVFILMHMRRLFFYLFYHILPVIGEYILNKYFSNISQINVNNPELKNFMNIIKFLKRIDPKEFIDEIKRICNLSQEQYQTLSQDINIILQGFSQLSPQQEINNIRQSIIQSKNPVLINAVENLSSSANTGVNPIGLGNQGNQLFRQFHSQPMPRYNSGRVINLTGETVSSSARSGVGPNGFGTQPFSSQPIPPYNRERVINLTGEIPQPRRRGPIIQAHNSSSTITGVGPMEVVEFIGFVISIPFRIIFFFMQFAG